MHDISTMIAGMDYAQRSRLPCIGAERADLVVARCAILEALRPFRPLGQAKQVRPQPRREQQQRRQQHG